jgi:iron(III) transport system substrate-binding protein
MTTRHLRVSCAAIGFLFFAHALGAGQVVVYCSIKEGIGRPVAEHFEKETNTSVKLVPGKGRATSKELVARLIAEKNRSRADVFWCCDPAGAIILKSRGLSAPYESLNAKNVPDLYSDPEHHWTGFAANARVIIYNKNLLTDPEAIPTSIFDMMNPRFNRRACIANPLFGTTSMHAAALFQVLGRDMAEVFFNSLKTNKITMVSSNSEVRNRVAAGDFAFGVADSDDLNVAFKGGSPIGVVFPDQQAFGTLVIPNALVLITNGPNPEQGKRFIDFLLRPEIQKLLGASRAIPTLDSIKPMALDYGKLVSQSEELSKGFLKVWSDKQK